MPKKRTMILLSLGLTLLVGLATAQEPPASTPPPVDEVPEVSTPSATPELPPMETVATETPSVRETTQALAPVTRYAILFFGFGIALNELGIGESLVTVAVGSVLGGAALALGLAFGLGGRDRAQRLIEETDGS